jgi:hypothetical protein
MSTALPQAFDASKVDPQSDYTPLKPGTYPMWIVDSEVRPNKSNTGMIIDIKLEVTDGEGKGRQVRDFINFMHEKEQVQEIGQRQFSALCHAAGLSNVKDTTELHHKPLVVKVDVEESSYVSKEGENKTSMQNRVKAYVYKDDSTPANVATPTQANKKPWEK